jgi:hypothetical protein
MSRFAAALGAVLLVMVTGPVAMADPKPDALKNVPRKAARKDSVRIGLADINPRSLNSFTKNLKVTAKVYNQTGQPLVNVMIGLRAGQRFVSRSAMQAFAVDPDSDGDTPIAPPSKPITIPANGSTEVPLTVRNLSGIPLRRHELGVYPLSIVASTSDGTRLAHLHTFITYAPSPKDLKAIKRTKVAFVWPLIDKPTQVSENQFLDDSLADSVTKGRLSTLLTAVGGTSTPVTLAIDPDLVAAVKKIGTTDYTVGKVSDQKPVPTKKRPDALSWLTQLQGNKNKIFLTPYGDVDTVALVRGGLKGSVLRKAYDKGERDLALATLGKSKEDYPQLAWPVGGVIDQKTINETAATGRDVFLLNSTELASGSGATADAAGIVQTSKPKVKDKTAVAYDVGLQNIISADTRTEGAELPAELRYLAETAMITAEEPATAGTLVVAPDRRWSPSLTFARALLDSAGPQESWLKPVSLGTVAKELPALARRRVFTGYARTDGAELPAGYLRDLPGMLADGTDFSTIFTPVDTTYERPALRAASSYWRTHPKARVSAQRLSSSLLRAEMDKVAVIPGKRSLAGNSGTVNLTISNSLDRQVTVRVRVTSTQPQLVVGRNKFFEVSKKIDAGANDQISVPMAFTGPIPAAKTSIDVLVGVNNPQGRKVSLLSVAIENKRLSTPGVIITIAALAVVVVGVGFRGMRARRLRKKAEDAQHGATDVL